MKNSRMLVNLIKVLFRNIVKKVVGVPGITEKNGGENLDISAQWEVI